MPWIDNQYTFPRAAAANLQEIWPWPTPAETPPAPAPINPLLRVKPLLAQPDDGDDWIDPTDPNVSDQFDAGASLRFGPEVDETYPYGGGQRAGRVLGTGVGLLGGVPGPGLLGSFLGAYSDVLDAEKAMETIGYARPDLSTWDAWDPVGAQAYGWTPDRSPYSQLMGHFMGITDPDAWGYAAPGTQEIWSEALDVPGMGSSEAAIQDALAQAQSVVEGSEWGGGISDVGELSDDYDSFGWE